MSHYLLYYLSKNCNMSKSFRFPFEGLNPEKRVQSYNNFTNPQNIFRIIFPPHHPNTWHTARKKIKKNYYNEMGEINLKVSRASHSVSRSQARSVSRASRSVRVPVPWNTWNTLRQLLNKNEKLFDMLAQKCQCTRGAKVMNLGANVNANKAWGALWMGSHT